jgi:hypothetical protein
VSDREFLHARLTNAHDEWELADYMHRLRAIIAATPKDRRSPGTHGWNSLEELTAELEKV